MIFCYDSDNFTNFCYLCLITKNACDVLGYETDIPPRCLRHSFVLHTHYEVAPPYPPFMPHISMVCPGIAVFNTGDSLVAVDIRVDTDESCCGLLSMQFAGAANLCPMSYTTSEVSVDDNADDDESVTVSESAFLPSSPITSSSPFTLSTAEEQATPKDATNTPPSELRVFRERNLSSGKENQLVFPVSVGNSGSSGQHVSVYNFETGVRLCKCGDDCNESATDASAGVKAAGLLKRTNSSSRPTCDTLASTSMIQCLGENEERSSTFELPWLTVVPPQLFENSAGLNIGMYRAASSSCSSVSSPVILQNDTQCFTYSVRRYSSAVSQFDAEGEYHSHSH